MSDLREFNEDNFEQEVIKSEQAVLVDFWAPWCGPCRMLGPVIDELAKDYNGKIKVGKLNVDENPKLAEKYKVMTIPTIAVFKNGSMIDKTIGARPKSEFTKLIEKYI